MTTPDLHMLTGAYALDALDEFERRQFERHLAECPECRQEVDELRATTARLGLAVSETPPASLRDEVLGRITEVRQEPPLTSGEPRGSRNRRGVGFKLVSVAAAVAVAVAIALGVVTIQTQHRLNSAQGELSQTQQRETAIVRLLSAPDLRAVPGEGARTGEGSVLVSESLDRGMLLVSGMPVQPSSSTYQAWAIVNGLPRSIGLLGPDGTSAAPLVFEGVHGVQEIAMTVEPAGGSPQPTTSPAVFFPI